MSPHNVPPNRLSPVEVPGCRSLKLNVHIAAPRQVSKERRTRVQEKESVPRRLTLPTARITRENAAPFVTQ
jgi:hypothetical protein